MLTAHCDHDVRPRCVSHFKNCGFYWKYTRTIFFLAPTSHSDLHDKNQSKQACTVSEHITGNKKPLILNTALQGSEIGLTSHSRV